MMQDGFYSLFLSRPEGVVSKVLSKHLQGAGLGLF